MWRSSLTYGDKWYIYILPHIGNLGVNGVFMAEPVSNFIGGIACFATMYFTVYRKLSTNIVKK